MLVLSRHSQERIQIGNDITIVVVQIKSDRVKIGIEAPGDVKVLRTELLERTEDES